MKNWKGKAVAVTLLVFVLYVLFNHMNLNPLYPEAAFAYCVLFTVLFAIFTLDKIGRFAVSQAANGAPLCVTRSSGAGLLWWWPCCGARFLP